MKTRRNTSQRRVILDELRKSTGHPTATSLYQLVRKRISRISLATVYRNLDLLATSGMVRKFGSPGREARFDGDLSNHYHVHCLICGRVDDLLDLPPQCAPDLAARADEWEIWEHRLEFIGTCPECLMINRKKHSAASRIET